MARSIDPATGRMKETAPSGDYVGFKVKQLSTGREETLLRTISVPAAYAGRVNIQFGGDSNMAGAGATSANDNIMALATRDLGANKYITETIYTSPWQQGGRTWRDWWRDMHVNQYTSYTPDPSNPPPSWVRFAYQPGKLNLLVLMLGTNDVGKDGDYSPFLYGGTVAGETYVGVEAEMTRVLNELISIGWVVLLINPFAQPFYGAKSDYLHNLIATKGPQLGAKVYDLSVLPGIGVNPKNGSPLWNDDLHYSSAGLAEVWTDLFKPAIQANS